MQISAVIVAHDEERQLVTAFDSVVRAVEASYFSLATKFGARPEVQVVLVLDRADGPTVKVAKGLAARAGADGGMNLRVDMLRTDFGEPGSARNAGVAAARGDTVLVMDGDDLVGRSFVASGIARLIADSEAGRSMQRVYHPEYLYYFGEKSLIWRQPSWDEYQAHKTALLQTNLWDVTMIAPRQVLVDFPYLHSDNRVGSGYEDWEWCLHTATSGVRHDLVPQSFAYKRAKPVSRFVKDALGNVMIESRRIRLESA